MKDENGLTPRQKAWCDYYIECGNAIEAAKKAGYSNPKNSAQDNKQKQVCKQYIAERMKPTEERRIASADEVLQFLTDVMAGRVKDQFGLDASLQDRIKASQETLRRRRYAPANHHGEAGFSVRGVQGGDRAANDTADNRGDSRGRSAAERRERCIKRRISVYRDARAATSTP